MRISDTTLMGLRLSNNLNNVIKASNRAIEHLSTGYRINSAADRPSDILRISRFDAQIRGSRVAQQNIQSGISLLQTADSALSDIQDIGQRLRELAVAYNSGTLSEEDKQAIRTEGEALQSEITHRLENTKFGGLAIFSKDSYAIQTGPYSNDRISIDLKNIKPIKDFNIQNALANGTENNVTSAATATSSGAGGSSSIPHYTLVSPTATIPDQNGFTGYREIRDGSGKIIYEGNLTNGKLNGYGKLYKGDKLVYEGTWDNGVIDGFGTLYDENGQIKYSGTTDNSTPDGYGNYYEDGKVAYQGFFKDGYRQGWGTTYYSNGVTEAQAYCDYDKIHSSGGTGDTGNSGGPGGNNNTPDNSSNWLSADYIDTHLLKPLSSLRSYTGVMENTLDRRLSFQVSSEENNSSALSKIRDVDVAKETLELAKQQLLASTNLQLIPQIKETDRAYILQLLS